MQRNTISETTVVGKYGVKQIKKDFDIVINHYPKGFASPDRFDVEVSMDKRLMMPIEKCKNQDDAQAFADLTAKQIQNGLFINKLAEAEYKTIILRRIKGETDEEKEEKLKTWVKAHKTEIPKDTGPYAYAFIKMKI